MGELKELSEIELMRVEDELKGIRGWASAKAFITTYFGVPKPSCRLTRFLFGKDKRKFFLKENFKDLYLFFKNELDISQRARDYHAAKTNDQKEIIWQKFCIECGRKFPALRLPLEELDKAPIHRPRN